VTTYDPKGLPQFATSDKIAAPGDGLREDLNLISAAASAAISVEGSRAEGAAKSYADTKDTDNRSAWAAADTATLNNAKSYTDGKDTANRSDWAAADATTLNSAKSYADSKDTASRSDWAAADTATLNSAKSYADGKFAPFWKANTTYAAGQRVIAPNGDVVSAKIAFTSGAAYSAANWDASSQDGRIGAVEAKQAVKCVRLESGKWVWDTVAGTHFVIPDHTGALIVRATAQPVPAATPALDW